MPNFPEFRVRRYLFNTVIKSRFFAGYYSFEAVGGNPSQNGDVNMDEVINILDIVLTVNYILNISDLTDYQIQLADMNADGVVNILDVISIINIILE